MKCRVCGYELDPNRAYCDMCGTKVIASQAPEAPIEKAPDVVPARQNPMPAMTAAQVPEVSSYTPQAAPVYSKAPQSTFEPPYTRPEAPVYTQPSKPTFAPTYLEQNPPGYSPEQAYIPQAAPAQSVESIQTYTQPEPPIRTFVPSVQQAPPYATYEAPAYAQAAAPAYSQVPQPAYAQPAAPAYVQPVQSTYTPQQVVDSAPAYAQPAAPTYAQAPAPDYSRPAQPQAQDYVQPSQPAFAQPEAPTYSQVPQPAYAQPAQPVPAPAYTQPVVPTYTQPSEPVYTPPQAYQPAAPVQPEENRLSTDTSEFSWNVYDFPKPKAPGDIPIKWPEYDYIDPVSGTFATPDGRIQAAIDNKQPVVMLSQDASEGFVSVPEQKELAWKAPMDESTRRNEQFFTFQKKNEEFQHLLDREYEKLQSRKEGETYREETFSMPEEDLQAQRSAKLQAAMQAQQARNMQGFVPSPMYQQRDMQQKPYTVQQMQAEQQSPYADQQMQTGQNPYTMEQLQSQQKRTSGGQAPVQPAPPAPFMPTAPIYRAEGINEFERMLMDNTKDADLVTGDTLPINLEKIQEEVRAQEAARLSQNEEAYRAQQNLQYQAEQAARSAALNAEMQRLEAAKQQAAAGISKPEQAPASRGRMSLDEDSFPSRTSLPKDSSLPVKSMNEERLEAMAKAREEYFQTISGLSAYQTSPITVQQGPGSADGRMASQGQGPTLSDNRMAVQAQGFAPTQTGTPTQGQRPALAQGQGPTSSDGQRPASTEGQATKESQLDKPFQPFVPKENQVAAAESQAAKEALVAAVAAAAVSDVSEIIHPQRPEDKRTKASLETTSLEKPIADLFAPVEEKIKVQNKKDGTKKRHLFWKVLLVLILIVALAEAAVVGMRKLIPENDMTVKATEIEQVIITTVLNFGESIKEYVTQTVEKMGVSLANQQEPEEEVLPEEKPIFDLGEVVATYNKNIQSITESPTLVYESAATYEVEGLGDMAVVTDQTIKKAIYACLISFNSKWVDYVNEGEDDSCLDLLTADGAAYRSALNFSKVGEIQEDFQSLMLGEMRMSDTAYYIFARELISVTEDGKTTTKAYSWVYELEDVAGEMKIVDYTPF